jgi:hypothetical protein
MNPDPDPGFLDHHNLNKIQILLEKSGKYYCSFYVTSMKDVLASVEPPATL